MIIDARHEATTVLDPIQCQYEKTCPGHFARTRTAHLLRLIFLACWIFIGSAKADPRGFLETIHRHGTLTTTVTENGDQDPAGVIVAPVSAGKIQKDDVLVTNDSNIKDLRGLGTTIVGYRPSTKATYLFASLPRASPQYPGASACRQRSPC